MATHTDTKLYLRTWCLSVICLTNLFCVTGDLLSKIDDTARTYSHYPEENLCGSKLCRCIQDGVMECSQFQNNTLESVLMAVPQTVRNVHISYSEFIPIMYDHNDDDDENKDNIRYTNQKQLTHLTHLTITNSQLPEVQGLKHVSIPNIEHLCLTHNNLTHIWLNDFKNLNNLEIINLSFNALTSVSINSLAALHHLKVLDLSYNNLESLSNITVFQALASLVNLNLSHNKLHYIHPRIFYNLQYLETVHLDYNDLVALQHETFYNMTSYLKLYLGNNPWNCDCGINWIVDELQSGHENANIYVDLESVLCRSPQHFEGIKVINLNTSHLQCEGPSFSSNDSATPFNISVPYLQSALLHCSADGFPKPSIYWIGPRGVLVHPSHHQWLPHNVHQFSASQTWAGGPTFYNATVTALENGSLAFRNFRYNFDGEYICVAANPVGEIFVMADVTVTTKMIHHLIWSVLFGGFCSVVILMVGIIIGSIQWIAERTCCKKDIEKSAIEQYYSEDIAEDSESYWEDYFRYLPYEYPDPTSRQSPMKCVTPAEPVDAEASRLAIEEDIWETLVDVRTILRNTLERQVEWVRTHTSTMRDSSRQLRTNVGKKVERVRFKAQRIQQSSSNYVQSIRDSSSTRLKTIRSSSSQYALRVKSGMADKVDAVKGQVKSFKEFCGTGEIGQTPGQTISVITVTTNVDSQEQSLEHKSHTTV